MELPDEIWDYIKQFVFDWKRIHKQNFEYCISEFLSVANKSMGEIYSRWTYSPPVWQNTNDIIRAEYQGVRRWDWTPRPNLELTSITWNINANENGGWWCGYGWKPHPNLKKTPEKKLN